MQFAEMTEHVLRADLIVPERPGWNQAGAPGTTCSACIGAPAAASAAKASPLASKASTSCAGSTNGGRSRTPLRALDEFRRRR